MNTSSKLLTAIYYLLVGRVIFFLIPIYSHILYSSLRWLIVQLFIQTEHGISRTWCWLLIAPFERFRRGPQAIGRQTTADDSDAGRFGGRYPNRTLRGIQGQFFTIIVSFGNIVNSETPSQISTTASGKYWNDTTFTHKLPNFEPWLYKHQCTNLQESSIISMKISSIIAYPKYIARLYLKMERYPENCWAVLKYWFWVIIIWRVRLIFTILQLACTLCLSILRIRFELHWISSMLKIKPFEIKSQP